jgi:hypothetical protein
MKAPELVEVDGTRLEEVLCRVEQSLDEQDAALVRAVFESYAYVAELVEDKNASIRRLRQLFFGAHTEKTDAVVGRETEAPDAAPPRDAAGGATGCPQPVQSSPGQGRLRTEPDERNGDITSIGGGWPRSRGPSSRRWVGGCGRRSRPAGPRGSLEG